MFVVFVFFLFFGSCVLLYWLFSLCVCIFCCCFLVFVCFWWVLLLCFLLLLLHIVAVVVSSVFLFVFAFVGIGAGLFGATSFVYDVGVAVALSYVIMMFGLCLPVSVWVIYTFCSCVVYVVANVSLVIDSCGLSPVLVCLSFLEVLFISLFLRQHCAFFVSICILSFVYLLICLLMFKCFVVPSCCVLFLRCCESKCVCSHPSKPISLQSCLGRS